MKKYFQIESLKTKLFFEILVSFFVALPIALVYHDAFIMNYVANNSETITPQIGSFLLCTVIIVGISTFVLCFLLMANRHIKYINYITKNIKQVANPNLGEQLEVRGKDELAELCININIMSIELKNMFNNEREQERIKSELITNISHDLRTPLTPIIAYLDILKSGKFKTQEEAKEYLNSSYNLSLKLKNLIDELFEYTKLSSNEVVLEFSEVDIGPIIYQVVGEYAPMIESKGLKVVTQITKEKLPVKIDVEKMVRVFENILSNAKKYSSKQSDIVVKVDNHGESVLIAVSNKGEYIEPDKLKRMFEKFYRVDISRTTQIEGSGLGLAISKKIVELNNGEIWAECHEDIITIKIMLPIISLRSL